MRIVFMGTPESAVPSLQRLVDDGHEIVAVWTQSDKPAGRDQELRQSPVKEFALQHHFAVHQPARIKNQEAKDLFASHKADTAVVVAYGKILPPEFVNAPRHDTSARARIKPALLQCELLKSWMRARSSCKKRRRLKRTKPPLHSCRAWLR